MFRTIDNPPLFDGLFGPYVLQLIFSIPGVMIASIPLRLAVSSQHQPSKFAGFEALVTLFVGMIVGWGMARLAPPLVSTGRWIWIPPAIVILPDVLRAQFNPSGIPWLSPYLFESVSVVFLTFPACSVVGYSIGMTAAELSGRWAKASRLSSLQRSLTLSLVALVLFGSLALALHSFERRSLARWAKVRTVLDPSGLQFSKDAQSLCDDQVGTSPARFVLLPWATYVEILERRGCDGDQLVNAAPLPPPIIGHHGTILMDRVRVLAGPHAGLEGWVLEYGLLEH